MKANSRKASRAIIALAIVCAFAAASIPARSVQAADDLYATGIGGGKTKPLVDIENRLMGPPKAKPVKQPELTSQQLDQTDTSRAVEDARKYQLYIEPIFPRSARLANKEGIVEVELTFDKRGKMKDARIKSCSTPGWGFEQAVLAASLESRLYGHGERQVTVRATLKFQLQ